jgi:hypothetical protein
VFTLFLDKLVFFTVFQLFQKSDFSGETNWSLEERVFEKKHWEGPSPQLSLCFSSFRRVQKNADVHKKTCSFKKQLDTARGGTAVVIKKRHFSCSVFLRKTLFPKRAQKEGNVEISRCPCLLAQKGGPAHLGGPSRSLKMGLRGGEPIGTLFFRGLFLARADFQSCFELFWWGLSCSHRV